MFNKLVSLRLSMLVQKIDDIHIGLNNAFHMPQVVSVQDLATYMGLEKSMQLQLSGIDLTFRRLHPKADQHFIDKWKSDIDNDPVWYFKWLDKYDDNIGTLPRTDDIPKHAFGIISSQFGRENLEGIISFYPTVTKTDIYLSLSELELYYQNVGSGKVLPGLGDMFMDIAVKFAVELLETPLGIDINPVTPGSIKQVQKRGYEEGYSGYLLDPASVYKSYIKHDLDMLLESDETIVSDPEAELLHVP